LLQLSEKKLKGGNCEFDGRPLTLKDRLKKKEVNGKGKMTPTQKRKKQGSGDKLVKPWEGEGPC